MTNSEFKKRRQVLKYAALSSLPSAALSACGGGEWSTPSDTVYSDVSTSTRPQDDFYGFANGAWLQRTEIPADSRIWGSFNEVNERVLAQLHQVLVEPSAESNLSDPGQQLAHDFYTSYMDEARVEAKGVAVLDADLRAIDGLRDYSGLPWLMARCLRISVGCPFIFGIVQDWKDASRYAAVMSQSGLGLPDRSFYLDAAFEPLRQRYQAHIGSVLRLSGAPDPAARAAQVLTLERDLAQIQWTAVDVRDVTKTYNVMRIGELKALLPTFDWDTFLSETGLASRTDWLNVMQPSYVQGLAAVLHNTPIDTWKAYFRWQLLKSASPYLSQVFVDKNFEFFGKTLGGTQVQPKRWKRAIESINSLAGDALGKIYVQRYVEPARKEKIDALVKRIRSAYRDAISRTQWLSLPSRQKALAKIDNMVAKVAYPQNWRSYASANVQPDDLWGNVMRLTGVNYERELAKLGRPVDRTEWFLPPQTVNAYYNPMANEIALPAAIFQEPFFSSTAEDAINYGAIGSIIAHEMSHAFDDQGSLYDEFGNLSEWWTQGDRDAYKALIKPLIAQYSGYDALPGKAVDGNLTLGENIADVVGLQISYLAYSEALASQPARATGTVADLATSPDFAPPEASRVFYLSYAKAFRTKMREAEAIQRLKIDPHSPPAIRVNAAMANQPGFYRAFEVKPGDRLYLQADERVDIWGG